MDRKISRREFGKRLAKVASGAALLALQPSCISTQRSLPTGQLLRNDLKGLSGTLLFDDAARQAAADDFGHIVHHLPTAVLKPGSIQDIVKLVQFANRHGGQSFDAWSRPRNVWPSSSRCRSGYRL